MAITRRYSPFLQVIGVVILIVVLARPLVFNGYQRGADFWVHQWYVWHQGESVWHGGPTLYLHDTYSVFVPRYAFYGGTLYAITGGLGVLMGSVLHVYVATYLLASGAAYGGWWWLGRQAGLGRLLAHAPALVFATSAYAITLVNMRSDWPEHIGVSMVPLLAASASSVLRADRLRLLPALALMVSGVFFFGSHNLSLLCGATLLGVLAALSLLCVPQARRLVTRQGVLRVAAILVPALLVNAWFLLPDLVYQSHTSVAQRVVVWRAWLSQFSFLVSSPRLFTLERDSVDPIASNYGVFALPILAMAWTVAAAVASRPRLRQPWLRMLLVLAAVTTAVIVAMTHVGLLVGPFRMLQYSMRLESYVNLAISGAVLTVLVLLRDRPGLTRRICLSALAVVLTISVVQATRQVGIDRDTTGSTDLTASASYYQPEGETHVVDYGAGDLPVVDSSAMLQIAFPPDRIRDGSLSGEITARPGDIYVTNVLAIPQLVRFTGAHVIAVDGSRNLVVQIDPVSRPGPVKIAIAESRPPAVRIGRWLSLLGLLGLAANLAVIAAAWRRRRPTSGRPAGRGVLPRDVARV